MNNLTTLIYKIDIHIISIIILYITCFFIHPLIIKNNKASKYLLYSSILTMILCLSQAISLGITTTESKSLFGILNITYNLNHAGSLMIFFFVSIFIYTYILNKKITTKVLLIFVTPVIANFILVIINLFYPIYYTINPDTGTLILSSTYFINFLITELYIIFLLVLLNKYKDELTLSTKLAVILSLFFPCIVLVIEKIFNTANLIYPLGSIVFACFYTYLKNSTIVLDTLTKIPNYSVLYKKYITIDNNINYSFALIDINNLNEINNLYTYQEGNNVISSFAFTLNKITNGTEDEIYLIGQDEFLICFKNPTKKHIKDTFIILDNSVSNNELLNKKNHSFSYSYVIEEFDTNKYNTINNLIDTLYYKLNKIKLNA